MGPYRACAQTLTVPVRRVCGTSGTAFALGRIKGCSRGSYGRLGPCAGRRRGRRRSSAARLGGLRRMLAGGRRAHRLWIADFNQCGCADSGEGRR